MTREPLSETVTDLSLPVRPVVARHPGAPLDPRDRDLLVGAWAVIYTSRDGRRRRLWFADHPTAVRRADELAGLLAARPGDVAQYFRSTEPEGELFEC